MPLRYRFWPELSDNYDNDADDEDADDDDDDDDDNNYGGDWCLVPSLQLCSSPSQQHTGIL